MAGGLRSDELIGFASIVVIRSCDATEKLGVAGLTGEVLGFTVPSSTGVDVVGETDSDFALNVYFDELQKDFWFAEELLVKIDEGAGSTIKIDGVGAEWEKQADGSWLALDEVKPVIGAGQVGKSPWWKFWR